MARLLLALALPAVCSAVSKIGEEGRQGILSPAPQGCTPYMGFMMPGDGSELWAGMTEGSESAKTLGGHGLGDPDTPEGQQDIIHQALRECPSEVAAAAKKEGLMAMTGMRFNPLQVDPQLNWTQVGADAKEAGAKLLVWKRSNIVKQAIEVMFAGNQSETCKEVKEVDEYGVEHITTEVCKRKDRDSLHLRMPLLNHMLTIAACQERVVSAIATATGMEKITRTYEGMQKDPTIAREVLDFLGQTGRAVMTTDSRKLQRLQAKDSHDGIKDSIENYGALVKNLQDLDAEYSESTGCFLEGMLREEEPTVRKACKQEKLCMAMYKRRQPDMWGWDINQPPSRPDLIVKAMAKEEEKAAKIAQKEEEKAERKAEEMKEKAEQKAEEMKEKEERKAEEMKEKEERRTEEMKEKEKRKAQEMKEKAKERAAAHKENMKERDQARKQAAKEKEQRAKENKKAAKAPKEAAGADAAESTDDDK